MNRPQGDMRHPCLSARLEPGTPFVTAARAVLDEGLYAKPNATRVAHQGCHPDRRAGSQRALLRCAQPASPAKARRKVDDCDALRFSGFLAGHRPALSVCTVAGYSEGDGAELLGGNRYRSGAHKSAIPFRTRQLPAHFPRVDRYSPKQPGDQHRSPKRHVLFLAHFEVFFMSRRSSSGQ